MNKELKRAYSLMLQQDNPYLKVKSKEGILYWYDKESCHIRIPANFYSLLVKYWNYERENKCLQ